MVNILAFAMLFFASCTKEEPDMPTPASVKTMQLSIGNKIFTATLEDNSSAESFYALLPTTLEMNELNGNEKYNYLETTLPVNSIRPGTINAGDIMLYGDNCIVVFYETFKSSYSYSTIGHINDIQQLKEALGTGNITIKFSKQ
ncbi:MAG: hypothetical protein IIU33_08800 [Bacteroidales bacterium]|nr:hypothetical protein [Bacteroidales bacterium]MBQ5425312.1 hypothetical protein [Bacteroidales bacterium]